MIKLKDDFLKGSYPPIITPFKDNGDVDYDSFRACVDFSISQGSHGILVTGTTGEPSTLTVEERLNLYKEAIDVAAGRVPVVAATGSQSEAETTVISTGAEKLGADALLIVTPYYVRPPQRGLAAYYIQQCKQVSLPVMIYHIPGRTAVSMQVDTVAQIMDKAENLVGMKHAVNDLGYVTHLFHRCGFDFRVFVGLEDLSFPMMCVGAQGLMNAVGNLAPKQVSQLADAVLAGNMEEARKLHFQLTELNESVFYDTNPICIKYMMAQMGLIAANNHRLPMSPAAPETAKRLDGVMERAGLTVKAEARKAS